VIVWFVAKHGLVKGEGGRKVFDAFDYFLGCVWSGWGWKGSTRVRNRRDMAFLVPA
jgi:hypothetical protein